MLDIIRTQASSWGIKILFGLIIIVFVFWGVGSMNGPKDSVVAYVNEEPILLNDYQQELRRTVDSIRSQNPNANLEGPEMVQVKSQVLNTMVGNILLLDEARKMGITVSNDEVRKNILDIQAFRDQEGKFNYKVYEFILKQQGQTPTSFELKIQQYLMLKKLQEFVGLAANVTPSEAKDVFDFLYETRQIDYLLFDAKDYLDTVSVTDKEINTYYGDHQDMFMDPAAYRIKFIEFSPEALAETQKVSDEEAKQYYEAHSDKFFQKEVVKAKHILIEPKTKDEAGKKAAEAKIKEIQGKLLAGEKFSDLAKKYSDDASAKDGGDLGWFGRDIMVEPFEEAAFALKAGEVSPPVETRFGYHLILVEERREAGQLPFDEVKDQVIKAVAEEKAIDNMDRLLDEATEQAVGGIKLDDIAHAAGLTTKESEFLSKNDLHKVLGLSADDASLIAALAVGKTTDMPMQLKDGYILAEKIEDKPAAVRPWTRFRKKSARNLFTRQLWTRPNWPPNKPWMC